MQALNNSEKNDLIVSPEEQFKNYPNYHFSKFLEFYFVK